MRGRGFGFNHFQSGRADKDAAARFGVLVCGFCPVVNFDTVRAAGFVDFFKNLQGGGALQIRAGQLCRGGFGAGFGGFPLSMQAAGFGGQLQRFGFGFGFFQLQRFGFGFGFRLAGGFRRKNFRAKRPHNFGFFPAAFAMFQHCKGGKVCRFGHCRAKCGCVAALPCFGFGGFKVCPYCQAGFGGLCRCGFILLFHDILLFCRGAAVFGFSGGLALMYMIAQNSEKVKGFVEKTLCPQGGDRDKLYIFDIYSMPFLLVVARFFYVLKNSYMT